MKLTQERLKELLDYDPVTGIFRWRIARGRYAKMGGIAGTTDQTGYIVISVDGRLYRRARLAFLYMTGNFPRTADHKNLNHADDSWGNLRDATQSQQNMNTPLRSNNLIGLKGVSWHRSRRKFFARIKRNGKQICLGYFDVAEDAHAAYCKAAVVFHGQFARTS